MVSFNIFKLFKRKKKPKNKSVDSNSNDTKLSEDAATKVNKVDEAERQYPRESPVVYSNGVEQVRYIHHRPATIIIATRRPLRRMPPRRPIRGPLMGPLMGPPRGPLRGPPRGPLRGPPRGPPRRRARR